MKSPGTKTAVRPSLSPLRVVLAVLFAALAIIGIERGVASVASSGPTTDRTSVWGDWQSADFGPFTTNLSGTIQWSVVGGPDNTTSDFGFNPGQTATATILQSQGTRGPDVARSGGSVVPYSFTIRASNGAENQDFPVTFTISPRPVSILGEFSAAGKTYDNLTTATISPGDTLSLQPYNPNVDLLSGVIGSDVTLNAVATFTNENVGTRTVNLESSTLVGAEQDNYVLRFTGAPTAEAAISKKPLTLVFGPVTKVYNGLTSVTVATPTLSGVETGDTVSVTGTPTWTFANKNVGTGKPLTLTGPYSLTGASSGNYSITTPTLTGDITARTLTIQVSVTTREYNGSNTAVITRVSDDRVANDVINLSFANGTFAQTTPGVGIAVTPGAVTASGTDSGNYTYVIAGGVTGTIEQKTLTIGGTFTVTTKDYDQEVDATGDTSGLTLIGIIGSETVSLDTTTLEFASANAGTHTVSITAATLTGTDVANYRISVAGSPTATGTIDPLLRTVTATNTNKVYDGTTTATPTLTMTPLDGDSATVTGTATYADANVADGIALSITGISVDNANYAVAATLDTTGNITPRPLTITGLTGVDRVYDALVGASATGTPTLVNIAGPDDGVPPRVFLDENATPSYVFAVPTVGQNKPIIVTGFALDGPGAGNYTLTQPTNLTASVTKAQLTAVATAQDKVYDSNRTATVSVALQTVLGSDDVQVASILAANRRFSTENQGVDRVVTVSNLSLTGTDAGNYELVSNTVTTTADITPRSLNVTTLRKTYDGSASGVAIFNSDRVGGDSVEVRVTATFPNKNAGTYSGSVTFDPTAFTIANNAAGNYELVTTLSSPVTGTINPKAVRIRNLDAQNKVYDAKNIAPMTGTAELHPDDLVGSEQLTLSATPSFVFSQATVGTNLLVSRTADFTATDGANGGLASNYTIEQPSFRAAITVRELTIGGSFTANNREYDRGNITAAIATNSLTLVGVQTDADGNVDAVGLNTPTVVFADDDAGTAKQVSILSATLSGNAGLLNNYSLSLSGAPTATADITSKALTVTVSANNKVYNQNNVATTTTPTLTGVFPGDQVTVSVDSATFSDENVANGKTVTIALSLGGDQASNYTLASPVTRTANITRKALTVDPTSVTANDKPYDQSNSATVTYASGAPTLVGVISGDDVTVKNQTRTYTFSNATAGTNKTVNTSGYALDGVDATNYSLTAPNFLRADIQRITVTPTFTVNDKVYNGSTNVLSSSLGLTGVLSGDTVTISAGSRTFSDKNVADNKTVTASPLSLGGTHAANYTLNGVTSVTALADITPFRLTVTPSAENKTYDGNTTATASCSVNKFGTDDVAADCSTASFDNKNVRFDSRDVNGTPIPIARTVTITGVSLTGTAAGNYLLPLDSDNVSEKTTFETTATINLRALKASGFSANDRDYDGTTAATFNTTSLTLGPVVDGGLGVVSGDENAVEFRNPAGRFDSRNAGTQNARLQSWELVGAASDNYTVDVAASLVTAEIRAINLTVNMTATSRTYNGNTNATVAAAINAAGLVGGDTTANISVSNPTGTFSDKNVGTGKLVTVDPATVTFSGSLAGNYIPVFTNPTANITARALVWTVTATNRVYDGTTDVVYTLSDNRVSGDTFTTNPGTGSFSTPTIGNSKTVTVTGISIADGDAANYTAPTTATGTANITRRTITVSGTFTAANKVYDRNTTATVTSTANLALGNVASGDSFTISGASATFNNNNVGDGKPVTLQSVSISGANSGNYLVNVSGVPTTTANITPRELTPTVVAANKRWDGTTAATVSSITVTPLSGDTVTVSASSAVFQSADQGTGITVTVSGISLGGAQAGNYTISPTATTTANITGDPLTVTISAQNKVYDGNMTAVITLGDNRDGGDDITITHSPAQFQTRSVGTGITVTITNIVISGPDADKYVLANAGGIATTTADITAKPIGITAESKVYDQSDAATVALDGVVSGDTVTFTTTSATFDDENVGNGKTVTAQGLSLGGTHGGNYSINATETTTANITPKPLGLTFTPDPPVNDVASNITVTIGDDRITGDTLTVTITDASTIRRGNQLVLVITGISVTGTDAPNYVSAGSFELVIRVFPTPQVPRPTLDVIPDTTVAIPTPTTTLGTRPPGTTGQTPATPTPPRPTPPSVTNPGVTPGQTGVPDILPGWRPPASPRSTIDFGAGVMTREVNPRAIADQIRVEPPQVVSSERFDGFAPGVTAQLEIMGARTIGAIAIPQNGAPSVSQLQESLQSIPDNVAPAAPRVFPASSPSGFDTPTEQEIELLQDALSWLGLPEATRGPGLSTGRAISEVVWQVEGFREGSAVFLVATSEPSLVAWGIAGEDGSASLRGYVLDNTLPPGDHRFRIVGTSVLDELPTDESGAITIGRDLDRYLNIFDDDTRVSVGLWGSNTEGADHTAVRYIDPTLDEPAPLWWWLLIPALVWTLLVLWRRRRGKWNEPGPTAVAVVTASILLIPAIVVGTVLGQNVLIPWAVGIGVGAAVVLVIARQGEPRTRLRPAT